MEKIKTFFADFTMPDWMGIYNSPDFPVFVVAGITLIAMFIVIPFAGDNR
jgi:hypothetical protein